MKASVQRGAVHRLLRVHAPPGDCERRVPARTASPGGLGTPFRTPSRRALGPWVRPLFPLGCEVLGVEKGWPSGSAQRPGVRGPQVEGHRTAAAHDRASQGRQANAHLLRVRRVRTARRGGVQPERAHPPRCAARRRRGATARGDARSALSFARGFGRRSDARFCARSAGCTPFGTRSVRTSRCGAHTPKPSKSWPGTRTSARPSGTCICHRRRARAPSRCSTTAAHFWRHCGDRRARLAKGAKSPANDGVTDGV